MADIPVANFAINTDVPQSDIVIPTDNPSSSEVIPTASPASQITIATPNPDFHYVPGEKVVINKQLPLIPNYGVFNPNTYLQGMSDYEIMSHVVKFYNDSVTAYNQVYQYQESIATSLETTENYFNSWGANLNADMKAAFEALQRYMNDWGTVFNNDQKSAFNHLQIYFNHWGTELSNDTKTAFNQLQQFVNEFFQNLDITTEIETIMVRLFNDGVFDEIVARNTRAGAEAWLSTHIQSGIAIDNSLTLSGAGADAKVTGDTLMTIFDKLKKYEFTTNSGQMPGRNGWGLSKSIMSGISVNSKAPITSGFIAKVNADPGDRVKATIKYYPREEYAGSIDTVIRPEDFNGALVNFSKYTVAVYATSVDYSGDYYIEDKYQISVPVSEETLFTKEYTTQAQLLTVNTLRQMNNLGTDEGIPIELDFIWPDNCNALVFITRRWGGITQWGKSGVYSEQKVFANGGFPASLIARDGAYQRTNGTAISDTWWLFEAEHAPAFIWNAEHYTDGGDTRTLYSMPYWDVSVSSEPIMKPNITNAPVYTLTNNKIYDGDTDITDSFIGMVVNRTTNGLEPPKLNYIFTDSLGFNNVYQYNLLTTRILPELVSHVVYSCSDDSIDYYVDVSISNITPPSDTTNHATVSSYSVKNAKYNEVVKRHILEYDSNTSTLKEGEVTYSYELLKSLLLDQQTFVIALINGRVYYPESISDTEIILSATYVNNTNRGYVTSYVAKLRTNAVTLTLVEYESEKEANKQDSVTIANIKRADLYPSTKAIGELVVGAGLTFDLAFLDNQQITVSYTGTDGAIHSGTEANTLLIDICRRQNAFNTAPVLREKNSGNCYLCNAASNISCTYQRVYINNGIVYQDVIVISANNIMRYTEQVAGGSLDVNALKLAIKSELMPVGYVYTLIPTNNTPDVSTPELFSAFIGFGTWERLPDDYFIMSASTAHPAGTTVGAGLPEISGELIMRLGNAGLDAVTYTSGSFTGHSTYTSQTSGNTFNQSTTKSNDRQRVTFAASSSSVIYGASNTVQPQSVAAYVYKRIG